MAHSAPPTTPSARIRALWAAFEKTLPAAQRTTQHKTLAAHAATDRVYDQLPVAARPTSAQHAATKDAQALELKKAYFERVVKEWNSRLTGAGLAAEMWTDITPEEMNRVTSALGVEENGEGQQSLPPPIYVQAPSLNSASRGANASAASWHSTASSASGASYALVKPSEIYSEDEDDAYFARHTPFSSSSAPHSEPASPALSYYSAPASASDNDADDDDDAPGTGRRDPFAPWSDASQTNNARPAWNSHSRTNTLTGAYPYAAGSGSTSASAAASVASLASAAAHSPRINHNNHLSVSHEQASLHTHGHGQRTASGSSASSAHASHMRSSPQLPPQVASAYVGPWMLTADEDEGDDPGATDAKPGMGDGKAAPEADAAAAEAFDRFKLTARMRMIVDFHAAAAAAEIKLAGEIWRVKRGLPVTASTPQAEENPNLAKTTVKAAGKAKAKEQEPTPRKKSSPATTKAEQSRRGFFGDDDDHVPAHSSDAEEDGEASPTKPATLVLAHQRAMGALQAAKDAERRTAVREERDRCRAEKRAAAVAEANDKAKNATATGKGGRSKDERRKGRSGTLISGQPAASAADAAIVDAKKEEEEEPWLATAWRAAHRHAADGDAGAGKDGEAALANALGSRFDLGTIIGGGTAQGVEAFLDGVVPPPSLGGTAQGGWGASASTQWSPSSQQSQPPAQAHAQPGWGVQQTPTATSFGAPPPAPGNRRRASTSASASASAAAAAAIVGTNNGATIQAGVNAFRRVHAPVPVRAAPFGEVTASASSSDEEGGAMGRQWGAAKQSQSYAQPQAQRAAFAHAPPLQALERELDPELMAAFVEYSGRGSGAGAVPLGSANVSSGSNSSGASGGYGYNYGSGSSVFGNASISSNGSGFGSSANHSNGSSMFGASNSNSPYAAGTGAFDTVDLEAARGRGGGPSAFASAAEALVTNFGAIGHTRGRSTTMTDTEGAQGWPARPEMHSRGASGSGHASAARSRSRSPTMTRAFPSWTTRMAGGGHAHEQQQPAPPQLQPKEAPARGPTATPVASGWTRKFQKTAPGTSAGTPQPQTTAPPPAPSSMFSLKNPFGFADDAEPAAAPAPTPTSSWLGGKGKKAVVAVHNSPLPQPAEPEVSLWEQVTQQKSKAGLVVPPSAAGSGAAAGKKPMPAVPSPPPPPEKVAIVVEDVVEKSAPVPPAGKKQTKKQRQAAMKKGGKGAFDEPDPEPEPEPESTRPVPPPAPTNGKGKFTAQAVFADDDYANENGDDGDDAMFSAPSKVYGGPPPTTVGRKRLDSLSASGGWDTEGTSVSTPRPAPKVPANLQALAASMSSPPPFGLKPLMGGAAHTQPQGERPGTGMGMNSSTIRARGVAAGQSGGGGAGRSLWGLFGGGSGDAAPKQQADPWAVPGSFGGGDEAEAEAQDGDDGGGGDGGGDDDWTPISRGSVPVEKPQAQAPPASSAQRLRRGSEAAAPSSPAPRVVAKAAAQPLAASKVVAAAASKKGNAKKGAKGKKVMIEDVPDEETDSRGEVLPVDSRHIFDDAESKVILEPKPSVPPGTYDSIISYTDEENERKPAKPNAAADGWTDDAWMEAGAKETTVKHEKTASAGDGAWGAGSNAAKSAWGPSTVGAEEEAEEQSSPVASAFGNGGRNGKGGSQPVVSAGGAWGQMSGKDKGKGKVVAGAGGGDEPAKPMSKAAQKRNKGKLF
ncbi:hypothetical protein HYPSUDRAFT_36126 [Hypholoma sublateritium FD-334 SS-4]|uniref:Uncharacterized protein n=1 Tax=Hypholoma sublateritium (strain FD-334 SS-4) TaxID=945553 RepID=A0A0D2Q5U3_HYPSF|nr:hypothetical protein HYPSUDRAFT_36126 [Hypholoma sublateritium FD-334 SS-4]